MESKTAKTKFDKDIWNRACSKSFDMIPETCPIMVAEFENIRKHLQSSLSGMTAVDHAEAKDREIREKLRKLHIGALAEFKGNTAQADASIQWYENHEQVVELRKLRNDVKLLRAELMESKFLTQALNNQLHEFRMTGRQVHQAMVMG